MSKIQVNLDELQNFAIQLGKAANECDQALGHINVDLYSLLANVPGVANGQINELEKIFRNNLKKYKNRLDDSQRLIRMTVAKMNETEMLLAREAAEVGRDNAGYYANLGMFNGSSGNSSGGDALTGELTSVEDISCKRPNSAELNEDTAWYDVVGNAILGVRDGVVKAVIDIFEGLLGLFEALTTDPLGFFKGIGNAVLHPVDTFNYMWGAVETAWERDVVNGNARSRGEFFSYALVSIVGLKGFDKAGKVGKLNKVGKGRAKVDGNTSLSSAAKVHTSNSLIPIPFNVFQTAKLKELVKHNVVSAFSKGSQWTKDFFKNDLVQKALKQGVVAISNAKTLSKIRNVVNPAAFNSFFKNTINDVIKGPLAKTKVAIDQQFRKVLEDIKNIKVPTQFRVEQLKTSVGLGVPVFNVHVGMTSMMDVVQKIMLKKSDGTENKNKPSEKKTDGKYLSKEEFNQLNNRLVEVDEVIDEHMEIGGDYHVYDDGLIVRKYLDMTGEKFITRYEIVDKIPNKDRTGGSKDLDSYFEGTPLAAVEYIGKPSTIAEKGVTKLVRKASKEDYLLKVSKDFQERLAIRLGRQKTVLVGENHPDVEITAVQGISGNKSEKVIAGITKGIDNANRLIPGKPGVVTGGDSTKLGKSMMEEMGLKRSTKWSGYQAQHIIPSEMAKDPVIKKIGMNFDDPSNGIFLRIPDNDVSTMSRHRGYHSVYNEVVERALNRMDINQSDDSLQKQVYDLQENLKKLQEKGLPLYPSQGATVELWERKLK